MKTLAHMKEDILQSHNKNYCAGTFRDGCKRLKDSKIDTYVHEPEIYQ